jgi:hypothetical protein
MTVGSTVLLVAISALQAAVLPRHLLGGWPWLIGTALPLLVPLVSALFVIRGYTVEPAMLRVQRLLWHTDVPLDGLQTAWASPEAMSGSLRIFGNGGLYSLSGHFRNSRLGKFRAFAMDPQNAVVLEFPDRKVVVTPESPQEFLRQLGLVCPAARIVR